MENKKNRKADLSRRSILFFQIGMILILFLAWQAIEWKSYERENFETAVIGIEQFEEEDVPIVVMPEQTPPPPVEIIDEIEVAEDEAEVEETPVESTEAPEEIAEIDDIREIEEPEEIEDVGYAFVEEVPVFPGCEGLSSNEERKQCMSDKIKQFVNREFDISLGEELGLSGINKIYVQFRIETDGSVTVIGARGPHPRLEEEAIRVAKSLPEMQPGRQQGKAVGVIYSLPITFRVQN